LRNEWLGFAIAGPRARELFSCVCTEDVSREAFPFLAFRELEVAGLRARVGRISFTGELGYEIWVSAADELALYDALVAAGTDLGLAHFGARALNSLRFEKSFGTWAREYRPIYTPFEAGVDRFVAVDKGEFIGRSATLRDCREAPKRRLVTLVVDAADADALGDEPVWHDGEVVGWVTSGGYGHCVGKSIALAYVSAVAARAGVACEVEILGERRGAVVQDGALYDPSGERMRSG
jgi:dimethylglycine dehydrogenase